MSENTNRSNSDSEESLVFSTTFPEITFIATIRNTGPVAGTATPQVYLLPRTSTIVQPIRQLVGFARIELEPGEEKEVSIDLDAGRFLEILNREWEWELEKG